MDFETRDRTALRITRPCRVQDIQPNSKTDSFWIDRRTKDPSNLLVLKILCGVPCFLASLQSALNIALSALIFFATMLIQNYTTLISSETAQKSVAFLTASECRVVVINSSFFCENFTSTSIWSHTILIFSPICKKKWETKTYLFNLLTSQTFNKNLKYWVFCYCSSKQTAIVQIFKRIFPFSRMNFQDHFKKFEFLLLFCRTLSEFTFSLIPGRSFYWPHHAFSSLPITWSQFSIFI